MNYDPTNLYAALIKFVRRYSFSRNLLGKTRIILMRGPWRGIFIRYYQAHADRQSIADPNVPTIFPDLDVKKTAADIERAGFCVTLQIPQNLVDEILKFQSEKQSNNIFHPHRTCESVKRIALDSKIVAVAREYLGAEPILYASRLYYTMPLKVSGKQLSNNNDNAKLVHFDVADYKDLSIFIYLSEVTEEGSPHIIFEGTHKHKTFRDLIFHKYTKSQAIKRFGANFETITGKAGLGFFEDPSTFHMRSRGMTGRFMLHISYTLCRSPLLAK